jgi:hypothetical protein
MIKYDVAKGGKAVQDDYDVHPMLEWSVCFTIGGYHP